MSTAVERLDDWLRQYDREDLEAQIAALENRVEDLDQSLYEKSQDLKHLEQRFQDYREETDRFMYELEGRVADLERADG